MTELEQAVVRWCEAWQAVRVEEKGARALEQSTADGQTET